MGIASSDQDLARANTTRDVRRPGPLIIVVCGPPCSGKSTISKRLQQFPELASFARFEMDELRLSLWPNSHTPQDRANAYARMHDLAAETLRNGTPGAILVATYQPSQQRRAVQVLADRLPARVMVFECFVKADEAVSRFQDRTKAHAATDLWAERVWDLAEDFRFFNEATKLDTSASRLEQLVDIVVEQVRSGQATEDLEGWIDHGNPPGVTGGLRETSTSDALPKLTARSRKLARRNWCGRKSAVGFSVFFALIAVLILCKAAFDQRGSVLVDLLRRVSLGRVLVDVLRRISFPGDATDWIQVWAVLAGLAGGLAFIWEHFLRHPQARVVKSVKQAGEIPRLALRDGSPSNPEVYRRYHRRLPEEQRPSMLIENVPLSFLVRPREKGFEVYTKKSDRSLVDRELLAKRAASLGLDWSGYLKWREKEKENQYYGRYRELGVRALGISEADGKVTLTVCKGSFTSYFCTELSANLQVEGRFGFELRQVFEGPPWGQSNPLKRRPLDLANLKQASPAYEMLVSVQVGLTTSDGYLILQRRSDMVQSASGGVVSSGAGSAQWKDLAWGGRSLVKSALRETEEEIGWKPHRCDDLSAPFLGAAFNLLRGRDLNFYCYFHTCWTLEQISAGPARLQRISGGLFRMLRRRGRPRGATRADDAWEVAHLIPVPVEAVLDNGALRPPFDLLVGDARHARGLLYCLARSDKFRSVQARFSGRSAADLPAASFA